MASFSIKMELSEEIGNCTPVEELKNEDVDLKDEFIKDETFQTSILKLEPVSGALKLECSFPRSIELEDFMDSSAMDINKSSGFPTEQMECDVKVESATVKYEYEELDETTFAQWKIKNEEVDIKSEGLEQSHESSPENQFNAEEDHLAQHSIRLGPELIKMNICNKCDHELTDKEYMEKHMTRRKNDDKIEMHKCNESNYKTKHRINSQRHLLSYKNPDEIEMHECNECNFKFKYKRALQRHLIIHRNIDEIEIYECNECNFRTKHKKNLQRHLIIHKNIDEIEIFNCNKCNYKTKHKIYLQRHLISHKNADVIEMHQCNECTFKTKYKRNLQRHLISHKNTDETSVVV